MNKKRLIIISIIIILTIIITFIFWPRNELFSPIDALKTENSSLSNKTIKELNNNYYQELKRLNLYNQDLTYNEENNHYQDNNYIGRFVSEEGYTYQFTINTTNNTVKIIEIANIQIERENLGQNYGGIEE
ncbi:MAG TPA: hypothetical protein IAB45_02545 [Candidatus Onthousia faecavium]|nr:hypothetical protein [Candidatus Onthousia faecavium]